MVVLRLCFPKHVNKAGEGYSLLYVISHYEELVISDLFLQLNFHLFLLFDPHCAELCMY